MSEQLNESAIKQIQQIVQELARRQGLSPEEAEEIGGHLEDKLLAYLSGEARITQGDALLLACAHFGDASGVARQLADGIAAANPELARREKIRSIAAKTGLCTLVLIPMALVLFGQAPETLHSLFNAGLIILVGLGVLEAGVLLAARTDLRSRWQRAVAAALVLPSLVVLFVAALLGMSAFATQFNSSSRGGYGIIVAVILASWLGHCLLFLFLAAPLPTTARAR